MSVNPPEVEDQKTQSSLTTSTKRSGRLWYFMKDKTQQGPVPSDVIFEMLGSRDIQPETLMWSNQWPKKMKSKWMEARFALRIPSTSIGRVAFFGVFIMLFFLPTIFGYSGQPLVFYSALAVVTVFILLCIALPIGFHWARIAFLLYGGALAVLGLISHSSVDIVYVIYYVISLMILLNPDSNVYFKALTLWK